MQEQATVSAPARKVRRTDESFGPPPIPLDDLKCCDCAYCGRELVGPSHRKYAHHFGMMIALMAHGRPYCPTCVQTVTSLSFTCMTCKVLTPSTKCIFQGGIPYCHKCSQPTWSEPIAMRQDRHRKGVNLNGEDDQSPGDALERALETVGEAA